MSSLPRDGDGKWMSPDDTGRSGWTYAVIGLGVIALAVLTPATPLDAAMITGIISGSILLGTPFEVFLQIGEFAGFLAALPSGPIDIATRIGEFALSVGAPEAGGLAAALATATLLLRRRSSS